MDDYLSKPIDPRTLFVKLAGLGTEPSAGNSADGPGVSVLDHAHLEELCTYLPVDKMRQLIESFREQIDAQISLVDAVFAAGDLKAVAYEAHSLAGAAGNFGALRLSRFTHEIEAACEHVDIEGVARRIARLTAMSQEASAGLREWLTGKETGEHRARALLR
jgi:HPt (histidine-containing phosphotransfer) domain-containing protein